MLALRLSLPYANEYFWFVFRTLISFLYLNVHQRQVGSISHLLIQERHLFGGNLTFIASAGAETRAIAEEKSIDGAVGTVGGVICSK
jgi:hypothetical protein